MAADKGPELIDECLVTLAGLPRLLLAPVALGRHVLCCGIGALALGHEPVAALTELEATLPALLDARGEVGLHLVQPRQLATERVRPLGGAGQLDASRGEPGSQRRVATGRSRCRCRSAGRIPS